VTRGSRSDRELACIRRRTAECVDRNSLLLLYKQTVRLLYLQQINEKFQKCTCNCSRFTTGLSIRVHLRRQMAAQRCKITVVYATETFSHQNNIPAIEKQHNIIRDSRSTSYWSTTLHNIFFTWLSSVNQPNV